MTFIETPRFPDSISEGASGGPTFKSTVFETNTGLEQRRSAWTRAKHKYDFSLGIRDMADMDTVREFFVGIRGRKNSFRFKDWNDFELTNENIGTGDGSETEFQITKTYTTGSLTYVRTIKKPVVGISVFVDSVLQTITTDYTIDTTTGIITFVAPPGNTLAVTVTGEFDVPVRFDVDTMSANHVGFESEDWSGVMLVEDLTA
jgi:uncharacterized protein (TIGR02217 family)